MTTGARLATREVRRQPARFLVASALVGVLTVLLLLLGALLDGLFLGSTGAIRALDGDAVVYSAESRTSFLRSRVPSDVRDAVAELEDVRQVSGLGVTLLGARVPGEAELADVAVIGYEAANRAVPESPDPGEAWADRRLEAAGVSVGDTLLVGPEQAPLEVAGWVSDASYLLQGGLWVDATTWRSILADARPEAALGDGTFQVLVVTGVDTASSGAAGLAATIDRATDGRTETLTRDEAIRSLPGTQEQDATFTQIIGITFAVTGLVVALFFALLVIERVGLYGVLKAMGASTGTLAVSLAVQAVLVGVVGFALGAVVTFGLAQVIPPGIPVRFETSRAAVVAAGVVLTALAGSGVSFRRLARIDPATAIGS